MEPFKNLNHNIFFRKCFLSTLSFLQSKLNHWDIPVVVQRTSDENFLMDLFYRNQNIEGFYQKIPRAQISFGSIFPKSVNITEQQISAECIPG